MAFQSTDGAMELEVVNGPVRHMQYENNINQGVANRQGL